MKIDIPEDICYELPTRQCCICCRIENMDADYVKREYSWICPYCVKALRKVLNFSDVEVRGSEKE